MLKHIFSFLLVLCYVNASLFNGLREATFAAKLNFSTGINNSPKLNDYLDLPEDRVFVSIDYLIKKQFKNKFEETLDNIVEQFIQVGYESLHSVNEVQLMVKEIVEKLRSLSNEWDESGSQQQNHNIQEFENYYNFDDKVIEDIKVKVNELDKKVGQTLKSFTKTYQSSEERLRYHNFLTKLQLELITNFDVNAGLKFMNEFNATKHPLTDVMLKANIYRSDVMDKLNEHSFGEYYDTSKDMEALMQACDCLLAMTSNKTSFDTIKQFIAKNVPKQFENKFTMMLISGGIDNLNKYLKNPSGICKNPSFMAFIFFELTDNLIPVLNESEIRERTFRFIKWFEFVLQNGFEYSDKNLNNLNDSAQQLMIRLKEHNERSLIDAIDLFKPFNKQFQGLFDEIEKELKKSS